MDSQHKKLFDLAKNLEGSRAKGERLQNFQPLRQHVEEHFAFEEAEMRRHRYRGYQGHKKEHAMMLRYLSDMSHSINNDHWNQTDLHDLLDKWKVHIIESDLSANNFMKPHYAA